MKFRKKAIIIEALQMTPKTRVDNSGWLDWMHRAWQLERETPGSIYPTEPGTGEGTLSIGTLEGQHLVSWNDWIIQGVRGELYPCKPDIFEATYESVESVAKKAAQQTVTVDVAVRCQSADIEVCQTLGCMRTGEYLLCESCANPYPILRRI